MSQPAAEGKKTRTDPKGALTGCTVVPDASSIIRIDHLTKIFREKNRTVTAVDDVTFEVRRGEIFGLLGPNGAGKSTLIRMLTTLLRPTTGTACVDTYDIIRAPEKIRSIIGVCPQNSTLDVELTAYDNLEFYGKLVDVNDNILDARIWQLLKMAELEDRAHMKVQTFSGGMRRKLEIVRAFIHHPLILFLDEPTIGLDPEARHEGRRVPVHLQPTVGCARGRGGLERAGRCRAGPPAGDGRPIEQQVLERSRQAFRASHIRETARTGQAT